MNPRKSLESSKNKLIRNFAPINTQYPIEITFDGKAKGLSLEATRDIKENETVLMEFPLSVGILSDPGTRGEEQHCCCFCLSKCSKQNPTCSECLKNEHVAEIIDIVKCIKILGEDAGLYRMFLFLFLGYGNAKADLYHHSNEDIVLMGPEFIMYLDDNNTMSKDIYEDIEAIANVLCGVIDIPKSSIIEICRVMISTSFCTSNIGNQFVLNVGNVERGRAFFPLTACKLDYFEIIILGMNHQCKPNVTWEITREGIMKCVALENISKGTELCISYVPLEMLSFSNNVDRLDFMYKARHFICNCRECRQVCRKCGKQNAKGKCSKCQKAWYCQLECQKSDWKKHNKECRLY
jgi:hypothetical protein